MEFHLYPSPEELTLIKNKIMEPVDQYKSSIFTLGLLLLHLALAEACDDLYNRLTIEMRVEILNERIRELREKYSQPFSSALS